MNFFELKISLDSKDLADMAIRYAVLLLVVAIAPIILLSVRRKTYPHVMLVIMSAFPCLLSLALLYNGRLLPFILFVDFLIPVIALIDLFRIPGMKVLQVEREMGRIASLDQTHPVTLHVSNLSSRAILAWMKDDVPEPCEAHPMQFILRLDGRSRTSVHYELTPRRRGAFEMEKVFLRVRSPFGFWNRVIEVPVKNSLHVYPNMKQLSEYAILARTNRLSLMGVRRTRKVGGENEFERLRDYTQDDNYKFIDWRTTARRNKLTVKDFQTSQSQRIIFMLDCGRLIANQSSGLTLLDHALNSALMLSYVALRQGDSVGMICFSNKIQSFVPPRGGMNQMNQLLHASFDRFPEMVESRYDEAFYYLSTHIKKRSLVVLITSVIDEVNANQLQSHLSSLVGRHLPLGVLLRDHNLFDAVDQRQPDTASTFRAAAAAEILSWRHQVLRDLEHQGVLTLDLFPENMTAPLINSYLNIKARHLL